MEEERKSFFEEHQRLVFWTRFALWTIFACVLPFIFIVWRFELFHTISKIRIGGWGLIAIVIVIAFFLSVVKYIKLALKAKYSFGVFISGF